MAIYTPRGLKIRLRIDHAFALMARLYPEVDAFKILKTTEGLASIVRMLVFVAGIVFFSFRLEPNQIGFFTLLTCVVGIVVTYLPGALNFLLMLLKAFVGKPAEFLARFIIPNLPRLGTLYSYVSGFGILGLFLIAYGFFFVGWQGVLAYFIGRIAGGILNFVIAFYIAKRNFSETGVPITLAEMDFFNAYRLHALSVGKTTDITLSDEEMKEENWKECFEDLARKWPEVVGRFTI